MCADSTVVSQRGVVFLRDQHVTPIQMKDLMLRISELSGCVSDCPEQIHAPMIGVRRRC